MQSDVSNALQEPVIVLNSFGFSGAEILASLLASHANIGLLPGQNFIQQEHRLYRPLQLPDADANTCFDLLSTKQYTKDGKQWAGLGKFMSDKVAKRYCLEQHRIVFSESYNRLKPEYQQSYTTVAKLYTYSYFLVTGENPEQFSHLGFYGSNLLLNSSEYPEFFNDTIILQVKPTVSQWLAMASQSRTWNPENAFGFYIIQNLFIALCEKQHDNIRSIPYEHLVTNPKSTIAECCSWAGISTRTNEVSIAGQGHVPITNPYLDKIEADAKTIKAIYQHSQWFEIAENLEYWADGFLEIEQHTELLLKYQRYWNSTAHIAFDWSGPLEQEIKAKVFQYTLRNSTIGKNAPGVAYHFYQQWFQSQSVDFKNVVGKPCYPLGSLESEIPLPKLQYFLRIAIHYLHTSIQIQGEQLHSYRPMGESTLYQALNTAPYQAEIDRNGLRGEFNALQKSVEKVEAQFHALHNNNVIEAQQQFSKASRKQQVPIARTARAITTDEINAIAVSGPDISEHETRLVTDAMQNWYEQPYFYCEEFERRFAAHHGRKFALMTPNCTSANHLLMMGLGIGPEDEVLVPESTWIASASPIHYTGAKPVFCDINEDDWCISMASAKQKLSSKTKAMVVVNLYGNMAKMHELEQFAKENNLYLIEDAAESIGSQYKGKKSGAFGVGSVFSFHRTKTLTTGEGGMLLLDDESLFNRCVKLRDHGRGPQTPKFTHDILGYKYMPFNVQAALGLAQLDRLETLVNKKRHILHYYKNHFAGFDGIQFNLESDDVYNSAWCSTMILSPELGIDRATMGRELQKKGVPTRPFFYPLSSQPAVEKTFGSETDPSTHNPVAYSICNRGINLPSALNLTDLQLDYVCRKVADLLQQGITSIENSHSKAA